MTSATGRSSRGLRRAGFTLLEIILVLGLIAFAGAIVVANFGAMAERGDRLSPEETVKAAVRQARFTAAAERAPSGLRFDEESGELVVEASGGSEAKRFALTEADGSKVEVRFYLTPATEGLAPMREPADSRLPGAQVVFAPDRSSNPFVVELDTGEGTDRRMVFDPFSSLLQREETP